MSDQMQLPGSEDPSLMSKSHEKEMKSIERRREGGMVLFLPFAITLAGMALGIILLIFSKQQYYVCGGTMPSEDDISLYPICLRITQSAEDSDANDGEPPLNNNLLPPRTLCLQAGAANQASATWCYGDVARETPEDYFLYFSLDAWRLNDEKTSNSDEGFFKQIVEDDEPEMPQTGDDWLARLNGQWKSTHLIISDCQDGDELSLEDSSSPYGIPEECYGTYAPFSDDNPRMAMERTAVPLIILFTLAFVYCFIGVLCCFDDGDNNLKEEEDFKPPRSRNNTASISISSSQISK